MPVPRALRGAMWGGLGDRIGMRLGEAELSLDRYQSFGELFTRRLQPGSRPPDADPSAFLCPVDGCMSAAGEARGDRLLQAKGIDYSLTELVGDRALGAQLEGGSFATIYLRPKDYHRIHAPVGARLISLRRWPGTLFPVQPSSVRAIKGLFVRNERVVLEMLVGSKKLAAVFVGAAAVGAIQTPFDDGSVACREFSPPINVARGDEIGVFELGSTVILVCERGLVELDALASGQEQRMGRSMGRLVSPPPQPAQGAKGETA